MGIAKTSPVPDHCPNCGGDTPTTIDLNKGGQLVGNCGVCGVNKGGGAIEMVMDQPEHVGRKRVRTSAPIVGAGSKVGGAADEDMRVLPAMAKRVDPDNVVQLPMRGPLPAASARVVPGAIRTRESPGGFTATDIVEGARLQLAELDAQIPALEAELAAAKTHRKGLAKMVAAYDSVAPRRAPAPAIVDPGPPPPAPTAAAQTHQVQGDVAITYVDTPASTTTPTTKPARQRVGGRFARGERKTT